MELKAGFKQTEFGIIPEKWEVLVLEQTARVVDSLHQTPVFSEDGYPMVRVTDIKTGNLSFNEVQRVSETVYTEFTRNYKPTRGDIVLSRVGSYGVSSFVETDEPFCMGQNTVVIQPKLPARFLYYVLNSGNIRQQIEDGSYGSGYKSLSLKNIKELRIPVPPTKAEQCAIGAALSDVDALLAKIDRLIAKKHDLKQAAMQQLLTGKKRLTGFSGNWKREQLSKIGTITMGQSPPGVSYSSNSSEMPLLNGAADLTHDGITISQYTKTPIRISKKGDLLFCIRATIGNLQVADREYCLGRGIAALTVHAAYDSKFIGYQLNSLFSLMNARSEGGVIKGLRKDDLGRFIIELPNQITEQFAIAGVLLDMDAELAALEKKQAKTRALKQGMMQELLTGRIRLV